MYNNKHHQFTTQYNHPFGAHVNAWTNEVFDYITDLRPKVVKFLDPNRDALIRVRKLVPDALLIFRPVHRAQPLGHSEKEAFEWGMDLAVQVRRVEAVRDGLIDLVEGYNEVLGQNAPPANHRLYDSFQLGFMAGLQGQPVEPVAFNFGTGNMDADLILDLYDEVLATYKWLGFHEYDWPTMDRLHNQGVSEGNGGMWLALRYRRIMEPIIEAMGNKWSVIVTECGMTQGVLGGADVGYNHPNTVGGVWAGYPAPIPAADYWESLKWYGDELMKDPYVVGACLFTTGGIAPWESFETIGTITPFIKDYQKVVENGGDMSDVYVNDVRVGDDNSLNLIPRIETFEELKQVFGLDVDTSLGGDKVQPGQRYWKLVGFEVRTGVAAFLTQIKNANGNPADKILVYNNWPSAPQLPSPPNPPYFGNAKGGFTDGSGVQGAPYSGGAVTGPNGGPYNIWPSADPAGGTRVAADCAIRLGWIGGTDHLTANPIFQDVVKEGPTTPPPPTTGQHQLVIFDGHGNRISYITLSPPGTEGSGGRLGIFQGGVEVASVPSTKAEG